MRRGFVVALFVACGPGSSSTSTDDPATGSSSSGVSGPTSSTSDSSVTGATTTGGTSGRWRGMYTSGFGYAYFEDCASGEMWIIQSPLPVYEYCVNDPLFLEIEGTLVVDDPDWSGTSLVVTEILAGPCIEASCDAALVTWSACYDFDLACGQKFPQCDPFLQDCPEGQKCAPLDSGSGTWDDTHCAPIAPNPKQPGEPCSTPKGPKAGLDDCALGSFCSQSDEDTLMGTCIAQCVGSYAEPTCDDPADWCILLNDNAVTVCVPRCDPLLPDCAPGDTCVPMNQLHGHEFVCIVDASGDEGQIFDACEFVNVCDPGLACVVSELAPECDPMSAGCCLPFCDLDQPACPDADQECVPWYDPGAAPEGMEDVGVCGLPW